MADKVVKAERSRIMRLVRSRDTKPEVIVRRMVHALGYRFRLHRRDLPGTPDIVLPRLKAVINVHGCFWHAHSCRHGSLAPTSNVSYWDAKRARNAARDLRSARQLRRAGWRVLTIWECRLRNRGATAARIARFLAESEAASSRAQGGS